MKQIKWYDIDNDLEVGGILLDDGDVVCACCGSLIPKEEQTKEYGFELLEIYDNWIDFTENIIS